MSGITAPRRGTKWLLRANAWLVYGFFYVPILVLVIFSFSDNRNVGVWGGATFDWYRDLASDGPIKDSLWASIQIAIVAVMMLVFFSEAAGWFGFSKGFSTITLSHIAFNISFVSVVVRARIAGSDDKLEEAAQDLGATRWQAFRHVTLPMIMPGILGGALLAMTLSLDDVVVTQFVTGPGWTTLPLYVFGLIRKGVTPIINAVSVFMLVASTVLVVLSVVLQRLRGGEPI